MDEQSLSPQSDLSGPVWRQWLAANRKLAILGGLLVVLLVATGLVFWGRPGQLNDPSGAANQSSNSNNSATGQNGRTFERFQAVVNRPDPSPATNVNRPTKEETAQAIQELTNPKP